MWGNVCALQELILFSRADLERSIPSMVDGLKPGQLKIIYFCFKRNIRKDVKARSWPVPLLVHAQGKEPTVEATPVDSVQRI